jgi:hypothetical protein
MPNQTDIPLPKAAAEFRRNEDFVTLYANNIQFEATEWDIRLIFGELDIHEGKVVVEQHTGMNIPWLQAKLLLLYLGVQVAMNEKINGPIRIPKTLIPPEFPPISEELLKDNPLAPALRELGEKMRQEFVSKLDI